MRYLYILIIFILCLSCSNKETATGNGGGSGNNSGSSFYRIEIEPSLSFDRSKILMVRADTQTTTLNGIYSANVRNPIRNAVYLGENFFSPTISQNNKMFAYLLSSKIFIYDKELDTSYQTSTDQEFSQLLFIGDSKLLASWHFVLSLYDISTKQLNRFSSGFMPTAYSSDTVAFFQPFNVNSYSLNLMAISNISMDSELEMIHIDTFNFVPSSFGIESDMRRYCYSLLSGSKYSIYAGTVGGGPVHLVAESKYEGVVMLDFNTIIYSGEDGRLYRTDFLGTNSYPYWAAVGSQN